MINELDLIKSVSGILYIGICYIIGLLAGIYIERSRKNNKQRSKY